MAFGPPIFFTSHETHMTENDFIIEHLGLVHSMAKRFNPQHQHQYDDLVAIGMECVWKAFKTYNPSKGKFSTYVYRPLWWNMSRHVKKEVRFYKTHLMSLDGLKNPPEESPLTEYLTDKCSKLEGKIFHLKAEGHNLAEISRMLEIKYSECSTTYQKLLNKLQMANV